MGTKDPTPIVVALEEMVRRFGPERGMRGAEAGQTVRTVDPQFSPQLYGAETLRQFIGAYAKGLRVIGMSGLDPIYGLTNWEDLAQIRSASSVDLWRLWVSPRAHLVISIAPDGDVRDRAWGDSEVGEEVAIGPASPEIHQKVAWSFLELHKFESGNQDALTAILDEASPIWWRQWTEHLRMMSFEALSLWHEHRRTGLESELAAALGRTSLDEQAAERAFRQVLTSRRTRRTKTPPVRAAPLVASPESPGPRAGVDIVSLAQRAIGHMSEQDIRSLRLPLGAILDAMTVP